MGKEQELLEAARSGNLSVVERILNQRAKKTGPLASLRRGPGANTQDQSGYTSLHHAALNGHKDIVSVLLAHEASTNVSDTKGSTPLHLAAWTGNTEIVKILLVQGPSIPNVNHANHDQETPLHSAAQYGHTDVIALLLQHGSDPTISNNKDETPLDLAAQYGRLGAVEVLLKAEPGLVSSHTRKHSPLHLASRNGHKHVVKVLLDAGFDVNLITESGTALHEAALYGKVEVVKLLLDYGVDVNIEDSHRRNVIDILEDLNTAIAKKTLRLIRDHATLISTDGSDSPNSTSPPPSFISGGGRYMNVLLPERSSSRQPAEFQFYEVPPPPKFLSSSKRSSGASDYSLTPSVPKSRDSMDQSSMSSRSPSIYEGPQPPTRDIDSRPHPAPRGASRSSGESDGAILYEVPPPPVPLTGGKRMSDPTQMVYQNVHIGNHHHREDGDFRPPSRPSSVSSGTANYIAMGGKPVPPVKPPRRTPGKSSAYEYLSLASTGAPSFTGAPASYTGAPTFSTFLGHTASNNGTPQNDRVIRRRQQNGSDDAGYVDMRLRSSVYDNHTITLPKTNDFGRHSVDDAAIPPVPPKTYLNLSDSPFSTLYDEVAGGRMAANNSAGPAGSGGGLIGSKSTPSLHHVRSASADHARVLKVVEPPVIKPISLDLKLKRATVQIPLSPTNYKQPPTPDFPPPSPATAELGIHEKIRPLSQEDLTKSEKMHVDKEYYSDSEYYSNRRKSRDIETLTDEKLFATIDSAGNHHLTLQTENKSVSTDNIEEIVDEDPFAGLCRGSTSCPANSSDDVKLALGLSVPVPAERRYKKRPRYNAYENIRLSMESSNQKPTVSLASSNEVKSENKPAVSAVKSPFDENAEWAEITKIMESFGSGIARESVFAREMEDHFTSLLKGIKDAEAKVEKSHGKFTSVGQWLKYLNLPEYENLLILNGFDDVDFLGAGVITDEDLQEIGILPADHRDKLVKNSMKLPTILNNLKDKKSKLPNSVNDWLKMLHLEEYKETFQANNYADMDKVKKLWELDLNTVLDISKLGHRKRILLSLGDSSSRYLGSLEDFDLEKLNLTISELAIDGLAEDFAKDLAALTDGSFLFPGRTSSEGGTTPSSCGSWYFKDSSESLKIRPPLQLMSNPSNSDETNLPQQLVLNAQWRHQPEQLIHGEVNYTARYLGSTLVKEMKGIESSQKSIQKLKSSTREIAKIPLIDLSISYTGLKFIDAKTKQQVCEHEIRNIHCACLDADDLDHFAYMTKEQETNNYFCHVFCADAMDVAAGVILTLGQAFEVAYQLALKDSSVGSSPCSTSRGSTPTVGLQQNLTKSSTSLVSNY